jgi:hypothetical protein
LAPVIEVRTCRTIAGEREALIEALTSRALPAHRDIGIKTLGPFLSQDDAITFVWLRAFPNAESRERMKEAFYGGDLWLNELEPAVMPLIAHYESVLVEDTMGLWETWPDQSYDER